MKSGLADLQCYSLVELRAMVLLNQHLRRIR